MVFTVWKESHLYENKATSKAAINVTLCFIGVIFFYELVLLATLTQIWKGISIIAMQLLYFCIMSE